MTEKVFLQNSDIEHLCLGLGDTLNSFNVLEGKCYPIPRGGIPAAFALSAEFPIEVVNTPEEADFFMDDIIDSGATCDRYALKYPGKPFVCLVDKRFPNTYYKDKWVVFPWEVNEAGEDEGIENNIVRLLQYVGEDATREGLLETPRRVSKAWREWTSGYDKDAGKILKVFKDGADKYDQMVTVKDIPMYSKCEHHLADIIGTVSISYIPNGKIAGLSKLSRLVDMYARRLQVQERMTVQIADAIVEHLEPLGVGVYIKARHMCMESRGICQQGHHTITTALRGVIKEEPETRNEFMMLVNK